METGTSLQGAGSSDTKVAHSRRSRGVSDAVSTPGSCRSAAGAFFAPAPTPVWGELESRPGVSVEPRQVDSPIIEATATVRNTGGAKRRGIEREVTSRPFGGWQPLVLDSGRLPSFLTATMA